MYIPCLRFYRSIVYSFGLFLIKAGMVYRLSVCQSEKERLTCSRINAASSDATSSSFISSSVVYVVNGNETELADVITTPSVAARREDNT